MVQQQVKQTGLFFLMIQYKVDMIIGHIKTNLETHQDDLGIKNLL